MPWWSMGSSASLLSARASQVRDWVLFALAALIPAVTVGVLGFRALRGEEDAIRKEAAVAVEAAAERMGRDVEEQVSAANDELREATFQGNVTQMEPVLRELAPAFTDIIVLSAERELLVPHPDAVRKPKDGPEPERSEARARCRRLMDIYAKQQSEAKRSTARTDLLDQCELEKTEQNRWLWPMVALERLEANRAEALVRWLEKHSHRMKAAERQATSAKVQKAVVLSFAQRERAIRALSSSAESHEAIAQLLKEEGASAALRRSADRTGLITFESMGSRGALRTLDSGHLVGFVVHQRSVAHAIRIGKLEHSPDHRAQVLIGDAVANPGPGQAAPHAEVRLAPGLRVHLSVADPTLLARRASRSRLLLGVLAVGATAFAFVVAALLFARMRSARRSSALRTGFVSTVSHELRTPIASVRMLAELLEQGRVEPEEQAEVYEALAREAKRLGETVDRLLGFSRMAAGRYVLDRKEGSVVEAVAGSIETFEERHPEQPAVERSFQGEDLAEIDAGQIRLAVDNLLANALKYAPKGTPYRVVVEPDGDGIVIAVEDQGPGIARRDQARVFRAFERGDDRLSAATEGSGIGLALVQHVAQAHAGRVLLHSEPGKGARFLMWIPRKAP